MDLDEPLKQHRKCMTMHVLISALTDGLVSLAQALLIQRGTAYKDDIRALHYQDNLSQPMVIQDFYKHQG